MKVTRKSSLSGVIRSMELEVTSEQIRAWKEGALIQCAMPHLTPDEREFIISGITPQEWDEAFADEEAPAGYEGTTCDGEIPTEGDLS
jgi:hypothetical protein